MIDNLLKIVVMVYAINIFSGLILPEDSLIANIVEMVSYTVATFLLVFTIFILKD